jgi:hypothetical protein
MSVSAPPFAQLCALPDDVLRAVAEFMPPSGLLVLVHCSLGMQSVLHRQLSRRLDDLFALSTEPISRTDGPRSCFTLPVTCDDLERTIKAVFGPGYYPWIRSYKFIEAPKGYDGPLGHSRCYEVRTFYQTVHIVSPNLCPHRFVGWLHRRHDYLLTAEASP